MSGSNSLFSMVNHSTTTTIVYNNGQAKPKQGVTQEAGSTVKNSGAISRGSTANSTVKGAAEDEAGGAKGDEEDLKIDSCVPLVEAQVIGYDFGSPVLLGKRQLEKGNDLGKNSKVYITPQKGPKFKGFVRYVSYPPNPYTAENLYTAGDAEGRSLTHDARGFLQHCGMEMRGRMIWNQNKAVDLITQVVKYDQNSGYLDMIYNLQATEEDLIVNEKSDKLSLKRLASLVWSIQGYLKVPEGKKNVVRRVRDHR